MRLVPESNDGKIEFFGSRLGTWAEHAAEIGTSPAEVAALDADVAEARAALLAQHQARSAAMAATQRLNAAVENMARRGATIVQQIRARAAVAGSAIYPLALVPAPADPAPLAAPGTPEAFAVALQQGGSLTLRWKCRNPRGATGTMYHVQRSTDGGPMQFLAVTGARAFVDATVPPGSAEIVYQVRAVRSTAAGKPAQHLVRLGTAGGGATTTFVPTTTKRALVAA
jgi:hypothetical protein